MRNVMLVLVFCLLAMPGALPAAEPTLLDFYADWCGPCQGMKATVDQLAAAGYQVERVNMDQNRELAARYGVESIPCFVVVAEGREAERCVGQTSYVSLKAMFDRHRQPAVKVEIKGQPHPAWRYEKPVGHRAAVVRIYCQDDVRTRSIGSGVLVKWAGRLVVLTARHVVKDAKKIIVELHTKRTHHARVLKVDATWDCAILELSGVPEGVEVAEIEFGQGAMQRDGDRLESCGYGPDGSLAVNTGLFIGYRRSSLAIQGPDDWMVISGHARQGDSGGPVFNARGRLVGILWGTDGQEVVCVQAGRLHQLLSTALPPVSVEVYQPQAFDRRPTPPMPGPVPYAAPECEGAGCCPATATADKSAVLPWRKEIEGREKGNAAALESISGKLDAIAGRPAAMAPPDPRVDDALRLAGEANQKLDALTAALGEKAQKEAAEKAAKAAEPATFKEHLHEKAEEVKEKVDGVLESPFARHAFFIACAGIVIWVAISQHRKAGTPTLIEKGADALATATAGTPIGTVTNLIDKAVDGLGQRLRDVDAKIDSKVQAVQQQVTQTALATPAPSQTTAAAPSTTAS